MDTYKSTSVVIQAGGRSSRMGQDKGLVWLGHQRMVEHVIQRVDSLGDEVIITTNNRAAYAMYGMRTVADSEPGAGALPGLATALQASTGRYVIVVACDMPFLDTELLRFQRELAHKTNADIVVPQWDDRFQPMHAVYHRDHCLQAVQHALAAGQKRMISFYEGLLIKTITPQQVKSYSPGGWTFFNVNTPDDLDVAVAKLGAA